jgi:hypothetical protein
MHLPPIILFHVDVRSPDSRGKEIAHGHHSSDRVVGELQVSVWNGSAG